MTDQILHPPLRVKGAFHKAAKQKHNRGRRSRGTVALMQIRDGCVLNATATRSSYRCCLPIRSTRTSSANCHCHTARPRGRREHFVRHDGRHCEQDVCCFRSSKSLSSSMPAVHFGENPVHLTAEVVQRVALQMNNPFQQPILRGFITMLTNALGL